MIKELIENKNKILSIEKILNKQEFKEGDKVFVSYYDVNTHKYELSEGVVKCKNGFSVTNSYEYSVEVDGLLNRTEFDASDMELKE